MTTDAAGDDAQPAHADLRAAAGHVRARARAPSCGTTTATRYLDFLARPGRRRPRPRPPRGGRRHRRAGPHARCTSPTCSAPSSARTWPRTLDRLLGRRRAGVLLQLGRRGQRVRHQAGPQVGAATAATSSSAPTARSTAAPSPRCTPPASPQKHEPFQPLPEGFRHVAFERRRRARAAPSTRPSPPCCSSRCRARAASTRRPPSTFQGVRRAVRRARPAAHGRRGADRPRPHRPVVRLPALRRRPDVVTMAKALGNGMPIGACWARREVAAAFEPGDHATTFGGQPLATAAARAVLRGHGARRPARRGPPTPGRG